MSKKQKKKWKKLRRYDVDGPLQSYTPLGSPPPVECEDDSQLENGYLMGEGLYHNVEIGEGPVQV